MLRSWLHSLLGWVFASRDNTYVQFGPFAAVLKSPGEPAPLALLSMRGTEVGAVVDRIEQALSADDAVRGAGALFASPDWRPHLIGAVALILDAGRRLDSMAIWQAIDSGSWVTPQLVTTAYLIDPSFADRLRQRIDAKCAVTVPANLSPAARHLATGPATPEQRSAKLLASLVRIGMLSPELCGWLRSAASRPELAALQAADRDKSGNIAENWLKNAERQFRSRGRTLAPAGRSH
ncbi:MAG: hypothetical protein ABSD02_13610 [Steroidobacteraceae bacterium]|jgi:hypothetical protein